MQGTHPFLVVDTTAPSIPTGLKASTKTDRSVTLSWSAASDNVAVTSYDVFRDGTKVGSSTSTSYTDSGLTASTAYSYTVKARDAAGNTSAASAALSVTTSNSSGATVTFNVTASTVVGQNVFIVGDLAALGGWNTGSAIQLSPASYPTWRVTLSLPGSTALQYKYLKKDGSGNVTWESGTNRTSTTPATGTATLNDTWK